MLWGLSVVKGLTPRLVAYLCSLQLRFPYVSF